MSEVRAQVWARSSVTNNDRPVILDVDATLVEVHSENKEGSARPLTAGAVSAVGVPVG
jgi:predicted HAD superfamily phosphohydrolase YqeG